MKNITLNFNKYNISGCISILYFFIIIGTSKSLAQNNEVTLQDYLQEVWESNELLQMRALGAAITDQQLEAEKAIFDPVFVSQIYALDEQRPNTSEQRLGFSDWC